MVIFSGFSLVTDIISCSLSTLTKILPPSTLIKILPFLAVIAFEFVPRSTPEKFESVYDRHFDASSYQLIRGGTHQSWDSVLREELEGFEGITEEDFGEIADEVNESVIIDEEGLKDFISTYVTYSDDWIRARVSIFVAFVSILAILFAKLTEAPKTSEGAILIVSAVIFIFLFLFEIYIDYYFEKLYPHEYCRRKKESHVSKPIGYVLIINIILILVVIGIDNIVPIIS